MLTAHTPTATQHGTRTRRVLIIEDDAAIRASLASLFDDDGYEVALASNGKEALTALRTGAQPPDLIVLDLMMPVMDGWEFRALQKADPALADIAVIAISADASPKAAAIHADLYLRKPFGAEELLAKAERLLLERERRNLEGGLQHAQRLLTLGTLSASILHEVNNPLAAVFANLCMAEQALPQMRVDLATVTASRLEPAAATAAAGLQRGLNEVNDVVNDARAGAERMRGIVQGLRSFARAAQETRVLVPIQEVVRKAVRLASGQIRPRGRLELAIEESPPVLADEGRLTQVFLNILVNAAQALPEGRPRDNSVTVRVRDRFGQVAVEVEDTGAGMSELTRRRIFEPFFTTKSPEEGTGLGLPICRAIVEAHGGRIEVESELGRGTLVRVVLPTEDTGEHAPARGNS